MASRTAACDDHRWSGDNRYREAIMTSAEVAAHNARIYRARMAAARRNMLLAATIRNIRRRR